MLVLVLAFGLLEVKKSATSTKDDDEDDWVKGAGMRSLGEGMYEAREIAIEHMQFEAAAAKAPAKIADPIIVLSVND